MKKLTFVSTGWPGATATDQKAQSKQTECYNWCNSYQYVVGFTTDRLWGSTLDTNATFEQVLPKVIWEKRITTPQGREWNRLLCVLLATQYPLQTNPITQPWVCYIHMAMPHVSYTLHCAV